MGWPMTWPHTWGSENFEAAFTLEPRQGQQSIIEVASFVDAALIKRLRDSPKELLTLDRRVFEQLVAELFSGFGYQVELTSKSKDGGVDIVAIKHDDFDLRYLIQCKRPDPGNPVGIDVVRNLIGVMKNNPASKVVVATTTRLTRGARELVLENRWEVEAKEYDDIHIWIKRYLAGKQSGIDA